MRPALVRLTSPASDSTSRCFITAGSDIENGAASSLTESPGCCASRITSARRVASESAAKVRSSGATENFTMWLSILEAAIESSVAAGALFCRCVTVCASNTPSEFHNPFPYREPPMSRILAILLAMLLSGAVHAAEYMEKTPFQLSRAFSPGVVTSGGTMVWIAGQTATQDNQGNNIANNFEAQVKQVFSQIDGIMKRAGGSLDNIVAMTVFIKESRYGDRFVEMRKDLFNNGNYPGSALITVTNFARPGIEIEIQAVGVVGDSCSNDNPCSAEGKAKKAQNK